MARWDVFGVDLGGRTLHSVVNEYGAMTPALVIF